MWSSQSKYWICSFSVLLISFQADHYNWIPGSTLPTPFATKLSNTAHCATLKQSMHKTSVSVGVETSIRWTIAAFRPTLLRCGFIWLALNVFRSSLIGQDSCQWVSRNRNRHLAARYAVFSARSSFGFLISGCVVDLKLNTVGVCSTELNSAYCRTQWWRRAGKKEILGGSFFFFLLLCCCCWD